MSLITLDWETYYDKDYSLKKLTTEEYIRHPQFEVIGVGVKVDDQPAVWFSGSHDQIKQFLSNYDWSEAAVLAHNTIFDGAILGWIFDIYPAFYLDTLSMARALHGVEASGSLKELASKYALGAKGDEVHYAIGKRRMEFSASQLAAYGRYCVNDTELTHDLFSRLAADFPDSEYDLIDITLRMFIQPTLMLDKEILEEKYKNIVNEKNQVLDQIKIILKVDSVEEARKQLSSNPKFKLVLESFGVFVPMKENSKGKRVPAFAKKDLGFIKLQQSLSPIIQQLVAARLGVKSTLEESRIEHFIKIGERNNQYLPVPLRYYAAHTGRWGGTDSVNLQNIPTRDKEKRTLKNSIRAPRNHALLNADASQIEARILAWLAGQDDLVKAFASGEDVYSLFATKIFGRVITEADVVERFVGKTCILGLGYGTGAEKLQHTLETTPPGASFTVSKCHKFTYTYRDANHKIVKLWNEGGLLLHQMLAWPQDVLAIDFGQKGILHADSTGIRLPNGLYIRYANLRIQAGSVVHDSRKGPVRIWGGVVVENCVQALARIIIAEQIKRIAPRYRVALTVHDSIVCVVRKEELDEARGFIESVMSTPPIWAPGLPIACKIKWGESYGDC